MSYKYKVSHRADGSVASERFYKEGRAPPGGWPTGGGLVPSRWHGGFQSPQHLCRGVRRQARLQ